MGSAKWDMIFLESSMAILIMALVLILHRVMTNRECVLTQLGRNSMAIYVIHPFIYYFFKPIWPEVFANQYNRRIYSYMYTGCNNSIHTVQGPCNNISE